MRYTPKREGRRRLQEAVNSLMKSRLRIRKLSASGPTCNPEGRLREAAWD